MSNDSIKQFLKPSATKIILTVALLFLPAFAALIDSALLFQIAAPYTLLFEFKPSTQTPTGLVTPELTLLILLGLLVILFYYYLIACGIVYLVHHLKNVIKRKDTKTNRS